MCEDADDPQKEPLCVQWCITGALKYEESEVEVDEAPQFQLGEMETGLEALIDKFGKQKVLESVARMAKKG
jgi:benzoyl-CoA reductase subunit BamC